MQEGSPLFVASIGYSPESAPLPGEDGSPSLVAQHPYAPKGPKSSSTHRFFQAKEQLSHPAVQPPVHVLVHGCFTSVYLFPQNTFWLKRIFIWFASTYFFVFSVFSSFANFGTCVPHIAVKSWIPNFACLLQIIIFLFQQFRAIPGEMDLSSLPELSHSQLLQIISQVVAELIRRASVSSEGVPIPPPTTPPLDSQVHSVRLRAPPRGQCGFKCQFCERACTRRGLEHTNHKCWNHRHER